MTSKRKFETLVYASIWLLVIGLYILDGARNRALANATLIDWQMISTMFKTLLPFAILFLINNYISIPRFLLRNRFKAYFTFTLVIILLIWTYQYLAFIGAVQAMPPRPHPAPHEFLKPLLPLPLFMDFTYAILIVGVNSAIALMFQRYDDKLEKESLLKANAENQLAYLKAQINPHFYMNMLNNIHGMIEVNPEKAQKMVIEMSQLMRYMLYESSRPIIPLADEVAFLQNYLRIMRHRFPEDKLHLKFLFPSESDMNGHQLPPLLFLVFVENAFKHGVSYCETSFIHISVEATHDTISFRCINSAHPNSPGADPRPQGIGLENVKRRLTLIYGTKASLETNASQRHYTISLTIPANETQNAYN